MYMKMFDTAREKERERENTRQDHDQSLEHVIRTLIFMSQSRSCPINKRTSTDRT
jgi:hypothetical protein